MSTRLSLSVVLVLTALGVAACGSNGSGVGGVNGPAGPGGGPVNPARTPTTSPDAATTGGPGNSGSGPGGSGTGSVGPGNSGSGPGNSGMGGAGPGNSGMGMGSPGNSGMGSPGTGADAGGATTPSSCRVNPSQCTDGKDNDGDGKADANDPECSGACDNDEGTFATGIPGDNKDDEKSCHQDCFFDGNSGQGDDGCRWDLRCDPARAGAAVCPYTPDRNGIMCPDKQSQACVSRCQQVTPNGCDCFGCCAIPGRDFAVKLAPTCNAGAFDDPAKCPRCTQVTACMNPCDKCEVCLGKPAPDPSCAPAPPPPPPPTGGTGGSNPPAPPAPGPPGPVCPTGSISCGPGGQVAANACPAGYWCTTGCCVPNSID
jgi:hypothetical protein